MAGPYEEASSQVASLSKRHSMLSVGWALIPLVTFGLGTPFSFAYGAIRHRSRLLALCTAGYALGAAVSFGLVAAANSRHNWQADLGTGLALLTMGVGTAQAFAIRQRVFPVLTAQWVAIDAALSRIHLREQARQIVRTNPRLADELQIGRPDLPWRFDDGGLVDVNCATPSILATVPGIGADLADQIGSIRDGVGGFESLDDLSVTLGIPPSALDQARECLIFRR